MNADNTKTPAKITPARAQRAVDELMQGFDKLNEYQLHPYIVRDYLRRDLAEKLGRPTTVECSEIFRAAREELTTRISDQYLNQDVFYLPTETMVLRSVHPDDALDSDRFILFAQDSSQGYGHGRKEETRIAGDTAVAVRAISIFPPISHFMRAALSDYEHAVLSLTSSYSNGAYAFWHLEQFIEKMLKSVLLSAKGLAGYDSSSDAMRALGHIGERKNKGLYAGHDAITAYEQTVLKGVLGQVEGYSSKPNESIQFAASGLLQAEIAKTLRDKLKDAHVTRYANPADKSLKEAYDLYLLCVAFIAGEAWNFLSVMRDSKYPDAFISAVEQGYAADGQPFNLQIENRYW